MRRVLAAAVAVGLTAAGGRADDPSADPRSLAVAAADLSRAREQAARLASPSFPDREAAEAELGKMGRLARSVLLDAADHPDAEVRARVARLLPKAWWDEIDARRKVLVADADLAYDHDLPGWKRFRDHAGGDWRAFGYVVGHDPAGDRAARDLYVQMLASPATVELLAALDVSAEEGGRAIADRRVALQLQLNPQAFGRVAPVVNGRPPAPVPPALGDIAALVFGELVTPTRDIPRAGPFTFLTAATFVLQAASMTALRDTSGAVPSAYRRLVARWLNTRVEVLDLNACANPAQNLKDLPETTPLLRRVVTTDGVSTYYRGQALQHLVGRDPKAEMGFVRSLFGSEVAVTSVWFGNGGPNPAGLPMQSPFQLRDLALALYLHHGGQKVKDFYYDTPQGVEADIDPTKMYGNYAFRTDDKRGAGFLAFALWQARQGK